MYCVNFCKVALPEIQSGNFQVSGLKAVVHTGTYSHPVEIRLFFYVVAHCARGTQVPQELAKKYFIFLIR